MFRWQLRRLRLGYRTPAEVYGLAAGPAVALRAPDTLSAVSHQRVKRPLKAKRNEVMTHSAAVVDKMFTW
jgi:hypothetical protein